MQLNVSHMQRICPFTNQHEDIPGLSLKFTKFWKSVAKNKLGGEWRKDKKCIRMHKKLTIL